MCLSDISEQTLFQYLHLMEILLLFHFLSVFDRFAFQNSRSFRMAQSLSFSHSFSHSLSHSSSGVGINFLGNNSLNRAQRLLSFVHCHKAVLNLIVRSRPAVLEGSLAALVRVTQLRSHLGFDAKRKYFFTQLHRMRPERGRRSVHLQLRRGEYL